ncbi:MAG: hypothetical protein NVS1B11_36650 [Terriglobales bacterium]
MTRQESEMLSDNRADYNPPMAFAGESDREYISRIDAERCTLQMRHKIVATKPQESFEDLPLFGGQRQGGLF